MPKTIEPTEKIVLEIENYHAQTKASYLINLKDQKIEDKTIYHTDYDVIHTVAPDVETLIKPVESTFDIADIDDDYIYDTDYPLIRLQQNSLKDSLLAEPSAQDACHKNCIGESEFIIYDSRQDVMNDYFHKENHDMILNILEKTSVKELDQASPETSLKDWLLDENENFVEFPDGRFVFINPNS